MSLDKEQKRQYGVNGGLLQRQEGCQSCCCSRMQQRGMRRWWPVKLGLLVSGELVTQPAAGQLVPAAACHPVPSINPQFPALVVFPSTLLFLLLLTSSSSKRHENQTLRLRDTKVSKPGKLFEKLRIPRFTLHRHRDQGVAGG